MTMISTARSITALVILFLNLNLIPAAFAYTSGEDGEKGAPQEVFLQNEPITVSLPGGRGHDGPTTHFCMLGPKGGEGGNGGDLYVHAERMTDLARITVWSPGGDGGDRGVCYSRNRRGHTERSFGVGGGTGQPGVLYWIASEQRLMPEQKKQVVTVREVYGQPHGYLGQLSRNFWDPLPHVLALVAPGSILSDYGYRFRNTHTVEYEVQWLAPTAPVGRSLDIPLEFRLDPDGNFTVSSQVLRQFHPRFEIVTTQPDHYLVRILSF